MLWQRWVWELFNDFFTNQWFLKYNFYKKMYTSYDVVTYKVYRNIFLSFRYCRQEGCQIRQSPSVAPHPVSGATPPSRQSHRLRHAHVHGVWSVPGPRHLSQSNQPGRWVRDWSPTKILNIYQLDLFVDALVCRLRLDK